jgi:hypothetical protein
VWHAPGLVTAIAVATIASACVEQPRLDQSCQVVATEHDEPTLKALFAQHVAHRAQPGCMSALDANLCTWGWASSN